MSGFKDMVARDNFGVFLNCDEFAEKRTVKYDGATYEDIPIVLSGLKEKDRRQLMSDHAQGLYIVSSVLHCALSDLGGCSRSGGSVSGSTTRRAAEASSGSSMSRPRSVRWVCCAWNWRRWTNELYPRQRGRRRQRSA